MTPKEIEDFAGITKNSVRALKYDLNNDGEEEILGMIYSTFYWGTAGYSLLILQKETNNYKDIAYLINFEPKKEVEILRTKNNGYYNIKFYNPRNNKYYKAKYTNKIYSTKIKYK